MKKVRRLFLSEKLCGESLAARNPRRLTNVSFVGLVPCRCDASAICADMRAYQQLSQSKLIKRFFHLCRNRIPSGTGCAMISLSRYFSRQRSNKHIHALKFSLTVYSI